MLSKHSINWPALTKSSRPNEAHFGLSADAVRLSLDQGYVETGAHAPCQAALVAVAHGQFPNTGFYARRCRLMASAISNAFSPGARLSSWLRLDNFARF